VRALKIRRDRQTISKTEIPAGVAGTLSGPHLKNPLDKRPPLVARHYAIKGEACGVNPLGWRKLLGTTFAGANQIVQRLLALKILSEITGQARNRCFRYDPYVRLFEGESGD
jgi:hypothetical protein